MSLEDLIIPTTISFGSQPLTRAGFGTGLILGDNASFDERIRYYNAAADLLADSDAGIVATDPEYLAAVAFELNGLRRFAVGKQIVGDSGDYGTTFDAVMAESNDWYGVICTSRTEADIDAIAPKAAANGKLYMAQTADADVITSASDDVASELQDAANASTVVAYHTTSTVLIDACALASMLRVNWDTQSTTLAAKRFQGATVDELSATARTNALAKNVLIYESVKRLGWAFEGKVAAGFFVDEIIIRDWYKTRIEEGIAQLLSDVSNRDERVPGGRRGMDGLVRSVYKAQHDIGVTAGHFEDKREDGTDWFQFSWTSLGNRRYAVTSREKLVGSVHSIATTGVLEIAS